LGTVTVGNRPRSLAVDSARQRVYVANFDSNSISVVNSQTNQVIQTIPNIASANDIAHDPTHNLIWVSNYLAGQVTPIQANDDATSFTVLPALTVGVGPWGVAYDKIHDFIYVVNSQADSVTVINAASRTVAATVGGKFNQPFLAAANPVTGKVYVTNFGSHSVTVLDGISVSRVVDLYDSSQPYGIAVDETRNLIYVGTLNSNRIVAIGPLRGVPDQFLGWAAFHRGFGNPRRPIPLRMIAVHPGLGPFGDGGHVWATTFNPAGEGASQALFIPKGWSSYFHLPLAQNVGAYPADGLAIDRTTNRVYVTSGVTPGVLTVLGDHANLCADALSKIASAPGEANQPAPGDDTAPISVEIGENREEVSQPDGDINGDKRVNILDLAFIAARFGSSDSMADLNADGRVDMMDLAIVARNYRPAGANN
jgi:YVTN family beta-propeller protein